jgi:hypothetical protein
MQAAPVAGRVNSEKDRSQNQPKIGVFFQPKNLRENLADTKNFFTGHAPVPAPSTPAAASSTPLVTLVSLHPRLSDLPAPLRPSGGRPKYPRAFDAFKAGSFATAAISGQANFRPKKGFHSRVSRSLCYNALFSIF